GLGIRIDPSQGREMGEAGHAAQPAEVLAAPADEIALGIVILNLEAGLDALNLGPALVQILLVAVHHARHHDLAALQNLGDDAGQLFRRAAEAAQKVRLAVAVVPPFAAGIGLVPPGADAGFAGTAVVKEDGGLAHLSPVHLRLPFNGPESAPADIVLDDVRRMLALDVALLLVNDKILLPIHRLHAHEDDVGGLRNHRSETHGGLDVGLGGVEPEGEEQGGEECGNQAQSLRAISHASILPMKVVPKLLLGTRGFESLFRCPSVAEQRNSVPTQRWLAFHWFQVDIDKLSVPNNSALRWRRENCQAIPPVLDGHLLLRRTFRKPLHEIVQISHANGLRLNLKSQPQFEFRFFNAFLISETVREPKMKDAR